MAEKLDGLRCVWTGRELITRNGTVLSPPTYFTRAFPNSCLDGELYSGKHGYKRVVEVVIQGQERDWLNLAFCVFDAPLLNLQFSQRYNVESANADDEPDTAVAGQQLHKAGGPQDREERGPRQRRAVRDRAAR